jgi:hypothetical protein
MAQPPAQRGEGVRGITAVTNTGASARAPKRPMRRPGPERRR